MRHWKHKKLLIINEDVIVCPKIVGYMKQLFQWANEMGLSGQRVAYLYVREPNFNDPIANNNTIIGCQVECSEEESKAALEKLKLDIIDNLMS